MHGANQFTRFSPSRVVTLLLTLLLLLPLALAPEARMWRSFGSVPEMAALFLLGLFLAQRATWRRSGFTAGFLRSGPHLAVLSLVLWGAVSWWRSPSPGFSRAEWIRLACGAGLYFVVVALEKRPQLQRMVDTLIGVVILTSLGGLVSLGTATTHGLTYPFGNSQLLAGFLLLVIPLLVVFAFSEANALRKSAAQAAAALSITVLALTETRSAWLGVLVALVVVGLMTLRQGSVRRRWARRKHELVVPLVTLVAVSGLFLLVSRTAFTVRARANTLAAPVRDASFQWRLAMWRGGWKLICERPLFGWGIGTFPLEQSRAVATAVPRELVERSGPTLAEEAHNEYIQTAAETGIVGLGLYLSLLAAFFVSGWRALRQLEPGFRQRVLMGCLAGVAGQTVDALSNPAWRFAEVSLLFWIILGLGMAAASCRRSSRAVPEASPVSGPAPGLPRLGWQAGALALTLIAIGGAWAQRGFTPVPLYNGPVQMTIQPSTVTVTPGQCVQFHAFADTNNNGPVEVTSSAETRFFTRPGEERCLIGEAGVTNKNTYCVPSDACSQPGCGGHVVPVFVSYGQPETTATAHVFISCPPIHDVAIIRLQAPPKVSRNTDAEVQVTISNHGTQTEQTELLLRVQPGMVVVADDQETLAAGETKTVTLVWPTPLMGDDGPKSLVAELSLPSGEVDSHPADNQAIQLVTVGP